VKVIFKRLCSVVVAALMLFLIVLAGIFAVPGIFGTHVYAVASGSMEPEYKVGSLVFAKRADVESIRPGDCITYSFGNSTVTHRVVTVDHEQKNCITKGDANEQEDPPVNFDRIIGVTDSFSLPVLGYLVIWLNETNAEMFFGCLILIMLLITATDVLALLKRRRRR